MCVTCGIVKVISGQTDETKVAIKRVMTATIDHEIVNFASNASVGTKLKPMS